MTNETKLYGYCRLANLGSVFCFGGKCLVVSIYWAKLYRRFVKKCFFTSASEVVYWLKYNNGNIFKFLGLAKINREDLQDRD